MLDSKDPLIALADKIDWDIFEESFSKYYSNEGRPAKPIRLMVGLLLLKQIENLSDENIVLQWKRNPYYRPSEATTPQRSEDNISVVCMNTLHHFLVIQQS